LPAFRRQSQLYLGSTTSAEAPLAARLGLRAAAPLLTPPAA